VTPAENADGKRTLTGLAPLIRQFVTDAVIVFVVVAAILLLALVLSPDLGGLQESSVVPGGEPAAFG
jgi:hypothetical protein